MQFSRFFVGTYAPHADRDAIARQIVARKGTNPVGGPIVPTEIDRLRKINWFPTATAALLALLALVAVAHAVATGTRRRRRDLAVLKTIGFGRPQVRHTVEWQATAFASRRADRRYSARRASSATRSGARSHTASACASASRCHSGSCSSCPPRSSPSTLIAFFPARAAARQWPAVALRSE